jgi:hypothetical protein
MEETPDSLPPAGDTAPADPGFGAGNRVLAGAMLVGALLLSYVCLDVLSDGRVTRILSRGPDAFEGDQ